MNSVAIIVGSVIIGFIWLLAGACVASRYMAKAFDIPEAEKIVPMYYKLVWLDYRTVMSLPWTIFANISIHFLTLLVDILLAIYVYIIIVPLVWIGLLFKKIGCEHSYKKLGFREEYDPEKEVRYSMRHYYCTKCHKHVWVDGRNDYIQENYHIEEN